MTWTVEGIARGPRGESMDVTLSDFSEPPTIVDKERMERALWESFPLTFGCDPIHIEVHIKEHS